VTQVHQLKVLGLSREDEGKRVYPPYRSYSQGNPSQVIFRCPAAERALREFFVENENPRKTAWAVYVTE